jgi:predicted component of type VI protein secretion system
MDGVLLVFDSRTLPNNLHALAPIDGPVVATMPKSHWRHRTFPAMAALILATVFSLVYFVSTQRTMPAPAAVSGASIAVPASELPSPSDANQTVPPAAAENNGAAATDTVKEETKPESNKASTAAPVPARKAGSKTTEPKSDETKKDDSKVGSILKKTGRILKKPFKF